MTTPKPANQNDSKSLEGLNEMLDHLFIARELSLELGINDDIETFFVCIADAIKNNANSKLQ